MSWTKITIHHENGGKNSISLGCKKENIKLWLNRQMKYVFPDWKDNTELEQENKTLREALLEAAEHIDQLSYDHNFNDCDIPDKYRAIAQNKE